MQSNLKVLRVGADGATAGAQTLSANGYGAEVAVSESGAGIVVWRGGQRGPRRDPRRRRRRRSRPLRPRSHRRRRPSARASCRWRWTPPGTPSSPGSAAAVVEANAASRGRCLRHHQGDRQRLRRQQPRPRDGARRTRDHGLVAFGRAEGGPDDGAHGRSPSFADGDWNDAGRASPSGIDASIPSVALDAQNTAIAIWRAVDRGQEVVQGAERPSDGTFRDFRPLSNPAASGSPHGWTSRPTAPRSPSGAARAAGAPAIQATRRGPGLEGEFGGVANLAFGAAAPADPIEYLFNPALARRRAGQRGGRQEPLPQEAAGMTIDDCSSRPPASMPRPLRSAR